nr:hypothetical protein GCM10020185_09280 [Pseudomonas brassicacearum subsp. brassicacearum]
MFESAEIGHAIDKETFEAEVPALREALLEAQFELQQQGRFPVIVLINGIEGAGKGETVKLLNEWMDPRLIEVRTFDQQTDEELARPPAWRYWRMLPAKGRMGIFLRQLVQPDAARPSPWRVQGPTARPGDCRCRAPGKKCSATKAR